MPRPPDTTGSRIVSGVSASPRAGRCRGRFQPPPDTPRRLPILAPDRRPRAAAVFPGALVGLRADLPRPPSPLATGTYSGSPAARGRYYTRFLGACARDAGQPLWRALRATSARFPRPARLASPAPPRAGLALAHVRLVTVSMRALRVTGSASRSASAPPVLRLRRAWGRCPHTPAARRRGGSGGYILRASLGRCRGGSATSPLGWSA